jgi:hypothetical protein
MVAVFLLLTFVKRIQGGRVEENERHFSASKQRAYIR